MNLSRGAEAPRFGNEGRSLHRFGAETFLMRADWGVPEGAAYRLKEAAAGAGCRMGFLGP
ncbi:hypothetical protein SAMN02746041_00020 [Desulfacinum hydrothermale DSM 13146]|uniref:Uncharacterized protein n=1 Tax=Desulfacinum hydrothermale DSM 13146 TaxID=1121390 RepID=A0A1W1WX61_9BACT|nr:hypothetical protein SAMN02746041_00020 [Desulfacinum hydrothermale DSM 13146]